MLTLINLYYYYGGYSQLTGFAQSTLLGPVPSVKNFLERYPPN